VSRSDGASVPDDHVIVLFGALGDLSKRKLLPGLFHLDRAGLMPAGYKVIGTSRRGGSDEDFRHVAREAIGDAAGETWQRFSEAHFSTPAYLAVHQAIRATGLGLVGDPVRWVEQILQEVPEPLRPLVSELAVVPLPANTADAMLRYCRDILARLFELQITRVKADKMGQLQRLDASADPEEFQRLNRELMQLEMQRRSLRSEA